ncbi:MAG: hypothetical protein PIR02_03170 [Microbacterium enclense]
MRRPCPHDEGPDPQGYTCSRSEQHTGASPGRASRRAAAARSASVNSGRWSAWGSRAGRIAISIALSALAVALTALLIASLIDLGQPQIWGTFTQTGCEKRPRGGCRPYGTWVSDDDLIVKEHVYLNGGTDGFGRARAAFRPNALLGSDVVDVAAVTGAMPLLIGVALAGCLVSLQRAAASWEYLRLKHGPRMRRRHPRRQGALGIRGSFRRQYRSSLMRESSDDR